jgi:PAS domain S-box-containing protein
MSQERGRILVVDDIEDDHFQLRRILKREFQIVPAYSAQDALEKLKFDANFDALITDQNMPPTNGDALIRMVKDAPETAHLRCLLLTGVTSDEELVGILRDGAVYHYFDKNKTLLTADGRAELVLSLRAAVGAARLERERAILTDRLKNQLEAMNEQYTLVRSLAAQSDPRVILTQVCESLVKRVPSRAVVGVVDLLPGMGAVGHVAPHPDARAPTRNDLDAWAGWARQQYGRLSGRILGEAVEFGLSGDASGQTTGEFSVGELLGEGEPPFMPVFVDRDLRGLLVLLRDRAQPLQPEEAQLFALWRDQLQDALRRVHAQALDEKRRVELMVETMNDGVVMTDERGQVTLINPAARRMLNLSGGRGEFSEVLRSLGLQSVEVLRQFGPGEAPATWREVRVGGNAYQVLLTPVRDHAAAFVGILALVRDITEMKLAEERRDEFVHIISHELRSPLTSIGGVLDLLMKQVLGELNPRQREYVEMAKDSCVRINYIINDLLDLAKFEKGRMPLTLESLNLEQVVRDATRKFMAVAIEKGVDLRFECELEGLICQGDANRLTQVVSNLLSNAIKYTSADGAITVRVFPSFAVPDIYLVSVHNTGDPIPDADQERIFDKFEQVDMEDRRSVGGTGLGLSICRSIIEGHGGRIWVDSHPDDGTCFAFSLPPSTPHDRLEPAEGGSPATTHADGRPVLLVSSEPTEALATKAVLLMPGYTVRVVPAAVERVRERLATLKPCLAIYLEPDGQPDGEVLVELAGQHDLPVVAMLPPGTPTPPTVDAVLDLPMEPDTVVSTLNVLLLRQRQGRRKRVLVVGADGEWVGQTAARLDGAGYLGYRAGTAEDAGSRIEILRPDLVVVDLAMSNVEAVLSGLGEGAARLPVLAAAPTQEEVVARGLVPDAHLPIAAVEREMLLKVRTLLATEARNSGAGGLVVLPGPRELEREVDGRIRDARAFALGAVDISGLKEALDEEGFVWGHGVLAQTAELVHRVLSDNADDAAFLGRHHDDVFAFLLRPEHCDAVCRELERDFGRLERLISGDGRPELRLEITAIVDPGGRFERFAEVQTALEATRRAARRPSVIIDRGMEGATA